MNEKIDILKQRMKDLENKGVLSKIKSLLNQLKELVTQADNGRVLSGMKEICAQCGKEGKSCCGKGVEFKYSDELLLINLIFGVKVPEETETQEMCFFLGSNGCGLFARDAFCINFICDKVKEQIPIEKLKKLREYECLQLKLQFEIEQILKKLTQKCLFN